MQNLMRNINNYIKWYDFCPFFVTIVVVDNFMRFYDSYFSWILLANISATLLDSITQFWHCFSGIYLALNYSCNAWWSFRWISEQYTNTSFIRFQLLLFLVSLYQLSAVQEIEVLLGSYFQSIVYSNFISWIYGTRLLS